MIEPIWLSVARAFEGLNEIAGPQSNPVILRWARDLRAPYTNDDTAWCALFMNRLMMACQLPVSGTGYDLLRAKTFSIWGVPLGAPSPGSIMVFTRPEGGHVGLYLGERPDAYYVLGGNTSNSVSAAWLEKKRLISIRWPAEVPMPSGGTILLADNGQPLSTNEV